MVIGESWGDGANGIVLPTYPRIVHSNEKMMSHTIGFRGTSFSDEPIWWIMMFPMQKLQNLVINIVIDCD